MTGEPDHILKVVCDDPRHARGKVAAVATFRRFTLPDGTWWIPAQMTPDVFHDAAQDDGTYRSRRGRLQGGHPGAQTRYRWPCKLCEGARRGQALEATEDVLQWLLESVYQHRSELAAQTQPNTVAAPSVSRVSLSTLLRVLSNLPEHPAR